ncbi:hypothetical protein T265_03735 [Opisthorchis viverrini]|uniref:Uncharacterized protein n=1 Tax=Opisthorchis viverrini TaxID=6198 RepID=A0A074ZV59_OPIVI|nr:hypothetical protein T265_03735 [Opisthorchis viverrini]KER29717.1 hypothetical protein T265_03735 [Opisthorchis viverrini]
MCRPVSKIDRSTLKSTKLQTTIFIMTAVHFTKPPGIKSRSKIPRRNRDCYYALSEGWRDQSPNLEKIRTRRNATRGRTNFCGAAVCLRPLEQGLDAALLVVYWVHLDPLLEVQTTVYKAPQPHMEQTFIWLRSQQQILKRIAQKTSSGATLLSRISRQKQQKRTQRHSNWENPSAWFKLVTYDVASSKTPRNHVINDLQLICTSQFLAIPVTNHGIVLLPLFYIPKVENYHLEKSIAHSRNPATSPTTPVAEH